MAEGWTPSHQCWRAPVPPAASDAANEFFAEPHYQLVPSDSATVGSCSGLSIWTS
jgi:hypothetical protein